MPRSACSGVFQKYIWDFQIVHALVFPNDVYLCRAKLFV